MEAEGVDAFDFGGVQDAAIAAYPGLKAATGPIAAAYYEQPSERLDVIAITGTNGKTSTAWWLAQALSQARAGGCGVIGTLGIGRPPQVEYNGLTTADHVRLQAKRPRFVDHGLSAFAVEASSIGIVPRRPSCDRISEDVFPTFHPVHRDAPGP